MTGQVSWTTEIQQTDAVKRRLVEFVMIIRTSLARQLSKANQNNQEKKIKNSKQACDQASKQTTKQASNQPTNQLTNQQTNKPTN